MTVAGYPGAGSNRIPLNTAKDGFTEYLPACRGDERLAGTAESPAPSATTATAAKPAVFNLGVVGFSLSR
jgi:hypothetical protein